MKTTNVQKLHKLILITVRYTAFRRQLLISLMCLSSAALFAQETVTAELPPFTRLSIGSSSKVKLVHGSTNSISFEGKPEDAERIKEMVEDDEFDLKGKPLSKA